MKTRNTAFLATLSLLGAVSIALADAPTTPLPPVPIPPVLPHKIATGHGAVPAPCYLLPVPKGVLVTRPGVGEFQFDATQHEDDSPAGDVRFTVTEPVVPPGSGLPIRLCLTIKGKLNDGNIYPFWFDGGRAMLHGPGTLTQPGEPDIDGEVVVGALDRDFRPLPVAQPGTAVPNGAPIAAPMIAVPLRPNFFGIEFWRRVPGEDGPEHDSFRLIYAARGWVMNDKNDDVEVGRVPEIDPVPVVTPGAPTG